MVNPWRNRLTIKNLLEAFSKAGYPKSYSWIKRNEGKGNLILPKSTTDFRKPRGDRQIGFVVEFESEEQIESIVRAFRPGEGKGYWSYK